MSKKQEERQLRDISKQHYVRTVEFLEKEVGDRDPAKLLKYIENRDVKLTTRFNYLNAIISLQRADSSSFSGNLDPIREARDKLRAEINDANSKNNTTDRQRKVMEKVKQQDILDLISQLKDKVSNSVKDAEDYILLSLMSPQPLRNDLQELKIVRRKTDLGKYNAIYLPTRKNTKAIVKIVDHKTSSSSTGKPIIKELDVELTDIIKDFVKRSGTKGQFREYLFQDRDGKPFTTSAFSHKFQRLFKKHLGIPFSSTVLRKIFWEQYAEREREMEQSAEQMAHGLQTVRKYYIPNLKKK
jgi:hypothetical protein